MMSGGHAASGALTGTLLVSALDVLDLAPITSASYLWAAVLLGAAGALWPDIDCDGSTAYRSVPAVTPVLGELLQWLSRTLYRLTAREHDPPPYQQHRDFARLSRRAKLLVILGIASMADSGDGPDKRGEHRGLTHWWGAAVLLGAAISWLVAVVPAAALVVTAVMLPSGIRALGWALADLINAIVRPLGVRKVYGPKPGVALLAGLVVTGVCWEDILALGPWLGVIVAVGMITHDAGDSITHYGVPWKALIPHRCDRCRARTPKPQRKCAMWDRNTLLPEQLTFTTGSRAELALTAGWLASTAGMILAMLAR